jgi:NitT/TauT family transport system permease protein
VSLTRASIGFAIGSSLGILIGLLTARIYFISTALQPFLNLLRPIPAIALVPVAIVWFGIGEGSKYFVISYTVFLAVWLNTHAGASNVASTYIRASRSLGASKYREFFEVIIPASAPLIVVGLRLGAALAFLSLVAAELSGASSGIGFRLQDARQFIRTDRMFVGLIELGILGSLLDALFVYISSKVVHWEDV